MKALGRRRRRGDSTQSAIALMAASASPRKPMLPTDSSSCRLLILLVAWRLKRHRQLFAHDAAAVVLDRDQAHAAGQQAHRDLRGAGVERVVDQLAHHRRRALDHLAGGDLADQFVGQVQDGAAGRAGDRAAFTGAF
jgi:hypothetical protein